MKGQGQPQQLTGVWVEGNFFRVLGIQPALGRLFTPDETVKGGRPVVLLSHSFWQRQFASNPKIIGQAVTLNDVAVTVVGVLPASFDFGSAFHPGMNAEIFSPAINDQFRRWGHMLSILGVLKPGVTPAAAQNEMNAEFTPLIATHPEWLTDFAIDVSSLKEYVSGKLRRSLIVLWCAVGLIQLIVCVNLSNLLLARAAARSKEFAMRSALGAKRSRILRQLLTESLVLSIFGASLGLGLAWAVLAWLAHQGSLALPLLHMVRIDGASLAWTLMFAVATAILFGSAPALRMASGNLQEALKDSGHGSSAGRKHDTLRSALVVTEIALASVLLVGAGLLLRSFLRVLDVDLGFDPSRAAAVSVDYDDGGNPAKRAAIWQQAVIARRKSPASKPQASLTTCPSSRNRGWGIVGQGPRPPKNEDFVPVFVYIVSPGYFKAMGMRLVARARRDLGRPREQSQRRRHQSECGAPSMAGSEPHWPHRLCGRWSA